MSDILIDVSYLNSAYRCLKGTASSKEDAVNFYRFLAEIIAHRNIYIKVNKDGPVYPLAVEITQFFSNYGSEGVEVKFVSNEKINYSDLIVQVVSMLQRVNKETLFSTALYNTDISPGFTVDNHPDKSFHDWLISKKAKPSKFLNSKMDGSYIPIQIADKLGLKTYFITINKDNWNVSNSLALAAKLRSLTYIKMANHFGLTYIPSATRGYNANWDMDSPSLRTILFRDDNNYKAFKENFSANENVISGIISRRKCVPLDCFEDAVEIRNKTKPLRDFAYNKPFLKSGDALIAHQFSKIEELKKIKDQYLSHESLFDFNDLAIKLSSTSMEPWELGFPVIEGSFKFINFTRKKRLLNKLIPLLIPILQIKNSQPTKLFKKLKLNAGLDE
jgi:hypothetical protein